MPRRRACLVVPAAPASKLEKGRTLDADEIVVDLEDAVVPAAKDDARVAVVDALGGEWLAPALAVRVNAIGGAVVPSGPDRRWPCCERELTAVVPKIESAADLAFADRLLAGAEAATGRTRPIRLLALIETPAGLQAAGEIARASERLDGLILGYADLAASLGRSVDGDWRFAQETVLVAARAAGIQAIDGPHLTIRDDDGFRAAVAHARALGLRRQVGDPPRAARRAARGVHAHRRGGRRGARARSPRSTGPPPTARAPWPTATGCSTRRSPCPPGACWPAPSHERARTSRTCRRAGGSSTRPRSR